MKEIVITSEKYGVKIVLVDDEDYNELSKFNWTLSKAPDTFYAYRNDYTLGRNNPVSIKMHRLISGANDPKMHVDHKDGNGLNNQRSNLRICTPSQNAANAKSRNNSSSKYLGVSWCKSRNKWEVKITKNYKIIGLGRYDNEEVAAEVYNKAAIEIHGEFANLNKIA